MALEDIEKKILEDAEKEASEIKARAERESEALGAAVKGEAQKEAQRVLKKSEEEGVREKEKILVEARLAARLGVLNLKQELVKKIIDAALEKVSEMGPGDFKKFLAAGLSKMRLEGEFEIFLPAKIGKELSGEELEEITKGENFRLVKAEEERGIEGGFMLKKGKHEINYSLSAIRAELSEKAELKIARILFGE